jgi:DnaJ-class molecular chaperone
MSMANKVCERCHGIGEIMSIGMIRMIECDQCLGIGKVKDEDEPVETKVIKPFKRKGRPKKYVVENNVINHVD